MADTAHGPNGAEQLGPLLDQRAHKVAADYLQTRLTQAQALAQQLVQQRARLTELLAETTALLNQAQGRIAELTELIAQEGT